MATKLNITVTNPALAAAAPLGSEIMAAASFQDWWQADAQHATLAAGRATALISRSGSGRNLAQVTEVEQATLTSGAIGAYSALAFSGGQQYSMIGTDPEVPLTWAVIYKQTQVEDATVFSSRTDASNQTRFAISLAQNAFFQHGSGLAQLPHRAGEWNLAIMGHDAVNVFISLNGSEYATAATNNAGGSTSRVLGALSGAGSQPFNGFVSDIIALTGGPLGNASIIGKVKDFARVTYGISVA